MVDGVVRVTPGRHSASERIDAIVLNRWLGIPIFLLMIYLMFTIAVNVGAVFIDFFDILFNALLVDGVAWLLRQIAAPEVVITLLANGVGGGITLVATFIPVIAFVIDRLMSGIGLPGNAFVPLIVGFGCNVPAVMATRAMHRDSDRLMTIAMAPFMSCGARLTVYALFAAAFFQSNGQNIVFGLYLLGIALAVFTGWIFRRQLFAGEITPSFEEMPAYHVPVPRNILLTTWFRLRSFIFRAGKVIVGVVVALSFLNSIGSDFSFGNEDSESSMLSMVGRGITPAFAPMGLEEDNWPATVGLFSGPFAAFCYLVFVLLYAPCVAVLGAVNREAGLPWTLLVFGWSTGLAYIAATVTYQVGTFARHPLSSTAWIAGLLALLALFILNLPRLSARMTPQDASVEVGNIIARSGRAN